MPGIPTLDIERLTLRAPKAGDFAMYRNFYADADASHFYGGPLDTGQAWRKLAYDIGHWELRGYGMWTLSSARPERLPAAAGSSGPKVGQGTS